MPQSKLKYSKCEGFYFGESSFGRELGPGLFQRNRICRHRWGIESRKILLVAISRHENIEADLRFEPCWEAHTRNYVRERDRPMLAFAIETKEQIVYASNAKSASTNKTKNDLSALLWKI
jgi:hypothetical protein